MFGELINSPVFTYGLLPLLIFLGRVCDVTIGTMRYIFVAKGYKKIAPLLGFFEIIIWLLAMMQIMKHMDNAFCYLAYGIGFATGNYIGIILEEKLSIGMVTLRIFPKADCYELILNLRENNFGVSVINVEGKEGQKKMLFTIANRKDIYRIVELINNCNPKAFYSITDVRAVNEGYFRKSNLALFRFRRKGK